VSGPLIGHASDRRGRKPLLILSQIGTFIGFIVLARATSLWMIYLSRVIDGVTAGNLSLAQAYIADNTPPERRAKAFGLIGIAFGLGFFLGPGVTGFMSARYGLNAPIYLAAAMSFTSIIATIVLIRGGEAPRAEAQDRWAAFRWQTYAQYFARPALRPLLLQFLFFMLAFTTFVSGFALFAERRFTWNGRPFGPREIGYVFAFVGFLGIILQGVLIGKLVARFGEARLALAGFASLVVGYFFLGATTSVVLLLMVAVVAGFGNGVLRPALTSLVTHQAGPTEQGVILGITQALTSMAAIVAPFAAGILIEQGWLSAWAWLAAAMAAVGLWLSTATVTTAATTATMNET
jgi:MFS family permease